MDCKQLIPVLLALKSLSIVIRPMLPMPTKHNLTYNITLAYKPSKRINAFVTYSTSFKPVGVNVAGLPTIAGKPATRSGCNKAGGCEAFGVWN